MKKILAAFVLFIGGINTSYAVEETCFYEHGDFKGKEVCYSIFPGTNSSFASSLFRGGNDNTFSSVRVPEGVGVSLFDRPYFGGKNVVLLGGNHSSLGSFNDKTSSISIDRVKRPASDKSNVCFFANTDFFGAPSCFALPARGPGSRHVLSSGKNNTFSSARVPENYRVEAYQNANFSGRKVTYNAGSYMSLDDFSDDISSFTIVDLRAAEVVNARDRLSGESDLKARFNTVKFLESILSVSKTLILDIGNGFWLKEVNLPENATSNPAANGIRVGSQIIVTTTAAFGTSYKGLFAFEKGIPYTFTYNGKDWDISKEYAAGVGSNGGRNIAQAPGLVFNEFSSPQVTALGGYAFLAGKGIGHDTSPKRAKIERISESRLDAYLMENGRAKVVEFEIVNKRIVAKAAKFRNGPYSATATDYSKISVAQFATSPGYGVSSVNFTIGTYKRKTFDLRSIISSQGDLSKISTAALLEPLFQDANTLEVNLADGFWLSRIDLPENTNKIVAGSIVKVTSRANFDTSYKGLFVLDRGVTYNFVYNGKTWDYKNEFGAGFVTKTPGLAFDRFLSPQLTPLSGTAMMSGTWIGGEHKATIVRLRENRLDAYIKDGAFAKVVELEVVNKRLVAKASKYRTGEYSSTATDYKSAPLASSAGAPGYGVSNVSLLLGVYETGSFNIRDFIGSEGALTKINTLALLEPLFQEANTLNVHLGNGYWLRRVDLPENTDRIVAGSTIKITTRALYKTSYKELFDFDKGIEYSFVYNGKTWDVTKGSGS